MSSNPLSADDLEAIKPPEREPAEQPDLKTEAEQKAHRRPSRTATERADDSHRDHLETLNGHIDHHKGVCEVQKLELAELRGQLTSERERSGELTSRCAQLETMAQSTNCLTTLTLIAIAVGGGLLSYAGATPDLGNIEKAACVATGATAIVFGVILSLAALYIGTPSRRHEPTKR